MITVAGACQREFNFNLILPSPLLDPTDCAQSIRAAQTENIQGRRRLLDKQARYVGIRPDRVASQPYTRRRLLQLLAGLE